MLTLPPTVKVMVCAVPVDMRKSFDGLAGAARSLLQVDPLSGHLLVFFHRSGEHVRILYWDRTGYVLVRKRLERGRFRLPWAGAPVLPRNFELETAELALIQEGIDLSGAGRRPRWVPGEVIPSTHASPMQPASRRNHMTQSTWHVWHRMASYLSNECFKCSQSRFPPGRPQGSPRLRGSNDRERSGR